MSPVILHTIATICFVAGKSGGHILPCITQAEQIKKEYPQKEMYLFSTGSELDNKIMSKHTHINHYIPSELNEVPYQKPWLIPYFCCNTAWYFGKSLYKLWQLKPEKVVSFGGFNSIPVCLGAKCLGIPFELYELNVEPGKATKLLSYFTDTIYTCFEQTKKYFPKHKCISFNYPVRFTTEDKKIDTTGLQKQFNFSPSRRTILILGGSQGSTLLNTTMKECIESYPEIANSIQIIHQTGDTDSENYHDFYKQYDIPAHVFAFHSKLQDFYNLADLIICRAGAGTLFEIKFFDKKCITIPHQTANTSHQILNALALQHEHPDKFTIIKQPEFNKDTLYQALC